MCAQVAFHAFKTGNEKWRRELWLVHIIEAFTVFCDLFTLKFGAFSMGIPCLYFFSIPTGIYFTFRKISYPYVFSRIWCAYYQKRKEDAVCHRCQDFVPTATRWYGKSGRCSGCCFSAGGAGVVCSECGWLHILGSATAIEATLAQIHKGKDLFIRRLITADLRLLISTIMQMRGQKLWQNIL